MLAGGVAEPGDPDTNATWFGELSGQQAGGAARRMPTSRVFAQHACETCGADALAMQMTVDQTAKSTATVVATTRLRILRDIRGPVSSPVWGVMSIGSRV